MNIGLIDVDGHNFPNLALMMLNGGEVFVSPIDSCAADYFHKSFIKPLLDNGGYIKEEFWGIPLTTSDGISYCVKKWRENQYKIKFHLNKRIMLQAKTEGQKEYVRRRIVDECPLGNSVLNIYEDSFEADITSLSFDTMAKIVDYLRKENEVVENADHMSCVC